MRALILFSLVGCLFLWTGLTDDWNVALQIFNMGLISAIMALGVNMQWGYAGLFNVGVMGFVALGGLATVLISMPPTAGAWAAGGPRMLAALLMGAATVIGAILVYARTKGRVRTLAVLAVLVVGFVLYRWLFDPARDAIEAVDPANLGYLGGLNLFEFFRDPNTPQYGNPFVLLAWPLGGLLAAGAAWIIGKTALGLRSDYLAIATLGISEIIIAIIKNEDWMSRGVKNVIGIPRPVPYEINLQRSDWFLGLADRWGADPVFLSAIFVKLCYALVIGTVLLILVILAQLALNSPWGRMMRAIRDNEVSAEAMGKDVTLRHLQIFVIGSAVCGIAGAMMVNLDGLLNPTGYQPLRFTFLIWVMVIVGGSGNNLGAVLGGMLIWYLWIKVEEWGLNLMQFLTVFTPDGSWIEGHLIDSAAQMRLLTMGILMLVVLRFAPRGLLPEK